MADTVTTYTIYPAQASGTSGGSSWRQVMRFTNKSDGTGESAVAKVTLSNLLSTNSRTVTKLTIYRIKYDIKGMDLTISFDRSGGSTPTFQLDSGGDGDLNFTPYGGVTDQGTGNTGNLLFTTSGQAAGSSYDVTIEFVKKIN